MKILIVTEDVPASHLGGAGKHAVLLGNALIQAGHEVDLLGNVTSGWQTNNDFYGKLYKGIDFSGTGLKAVATGIFNPLRNMLLAYRLWSAIRRLDYKSYDVIHYHGHVAELGVFVPKKINYVHTLHDQGSECMTMMRFKNGAPCRSTSAFDCANCATKKKPNLLQKITSATAVNLHRYLARKAFSRHKAIFVSEFVLRRFKEVVKSTHHINAKVIHNFTDVQAMENLFKHSSIEIEKKTRPVVLIAGRVHHTKGQAVFLDAISDDVLNKIQLRIAGDGPDFFALKDKHEKRGVVFLGWLSQEEVYKQTFLADACVVPSVWEEPCGTVSLEALALGKIVFALSNGGTPEQNIYAQYQNQLRLFNDIAGMARSLASLGFENSHQSVSFLADVKTRLPEIIDVYKTPKSKMVET